MDQKFLGLLDMLDGGGAGRSGQTFEGGPLSGFLNSLGVRPMGYMDRLDQARPMRRPMGMGGGAGAPSVEGMSTEELVKLIEAALGRSGSADMQKNVYAPGAVTTTPLLPYMSPDRFAPSYFGKGPR